MPLRGLLSWFVIGGGCSVFGAMCATFSQSTDTVWLLPPLSTLNFKSLCTWLKKFEGALIKALKGSVMSILADEYKLGSLQFLWSM